MFKKAFASISSFLAVTLTAGVAAAADGIAAEPHAGWVVIGIGLGIGLAAFGGTMAQGRASAAALEGIARNPNADSKVFTPMILGLAFIESLVLFTWVLMLLISNNL